MLVGLFLQRKNGRSDTWKNAVTQTFAMVASYRFVVRCAYEMDTNKHITKNDNTYAKKEADIYMKKKKVCIKSYFSHSHIYIYRYI